MNQPTVGQLKKFLESIPDRWEVNLNTNDDIVVYDSDHDEVLIVFPMEAK